MTLKEAVVTLTEAVVTLVEAVVTLIEAEVTLIEAEEAIVGTVETSVGAGVHQTEAADPLIMAEAETVDIMKVKNFQMKKSILLGLRKEISKKLLYLQKICQIRK